MIDKTKLTENFHFAAGDIALNRQGIISIEQLKLIKQNLLFDINKNLRFWVLIALVFVSVFFANKGGREEFQRNPIVILELLLMVVIPATLHIASIFLKLKKISQGKIAIEVVKGKVVASFEKIEGSHRYLDIAIVLGRLIGVDPTKNSYALKIGDQTIYTDEERAHAFESGETYTVYFVRYAKTDSMHKPYNLIYGVIINAEKMSQ